MHWGVTSLMVLSLAAQLNGQTPPKPASATDFDFLEGEWTVVYNNKSRGLPPNIRGTWTGVKQADGRVMYDEFRLFGPQGQVASLGTTYRIFDYERGVWDMRYVAVMTMTPDLKVRRPAAWAELTAWREGETIRVDQRAKNTQLRITYYNISRDHFSWKADASSDGGVTWRENDITIEATRKSQ